MSIEQQVLVCQNTACRKSGSHAVRLAFQQHASAYATVHGVGCLGRCGNGPMAIVLPQEVWYSRLRPEDVATIVNRHWGQDRINHVNKP